VPDYYRVRLAVLVDITEQVAASNPLRDFGREADCGTGGWFLADLADLDGPAGRRRGAARL
jgi:hypothetical protein